MAFTASDLIKLESAIAQGAVLVQYEDRRVQYQTLDEMIRLRNLMRAELNTTQKARTVTPMTGKGL